MKRLFAIPLLFTLAAPAYAQQCLPHASDPLRTAQVQGSATGTTGAVSASLSAAPGKFTYVCGIVVTSAGATTATSRTVTLTGTGTTLSFAYLDPVATAAAGRLVVNFPNCLPSSAQNTAITLSVPGTGTGTVVMAATLWGCQQ
jgi:hypothetical protein